MAKDIFIFDSTNIPSLNSNVADDLSEFSYFRSFTLVTLSHISPMFHFCTPLVIGHRSSIRLQGALTNVNINTIFVGIFMAL